MAVFRMVTGESLILRRGCSSLRSPNRGRLRCRGAVSAVDWGGTVLRGLPGIFSSEISAPGRGRCGPHSICVRWLSSLCKGRSAGLDDLAGFGCAFYECLTARLDALFELADAVLCTEGPVRLLVGLSLAPEHRRGHGALYDAVIHGRVDIAWLWIALAGRPLPRAADGRLVLAVDVSPWLRPEAVTCPDRSFCHAYGPGQG
jgi:DDE superfamily endonuclease